MTRRRSFVSSERARLARRGWVDGTIGAMDLVRPESEHLASYAAALRSGWSPDTMRPATAADQLASLEDDPAAFLASMDDPEGRGPLVTLPDGSLAPRLPGFRRCMWDGEFCGSIGLRWQPGTTELPPHCLGHIGYAVVPWKRNRGYATQALRDLLPLAWEQGLPFVELTTQPDNVASQRVIVANGGLLVGEFFEPVEYGGDTGLLYRIALT